MEVIANHVCVRGRQTYLRRLRLGVLDVRLVMPEHRRGVVGSLIVAVIFIGIGGGGSIGWGFLWGFGLIAVGVVVLLGGFRRR